MVTFSVESLWFHCNRWLRTRPAGSFQASAESLLVKPADPAEGRVFDIIDGLERAVVERAGPDALGLVKPDQRLGQGVIVGVTDRPDRDGKPSSTRCGFNSNVFQIRPIVDFDKPLRSAIDARDQCVAFFGVDSRVATMTSSTWSTVMLAGRPGLGSSTSPSRRSATNRARHFATVCGSTSTRAATALFVSPSALASTIFARRQRL